MLVAGGFHGISTAESLLFRSPQNITGPYTYSSTPSFLALFLFRFLAAQTAPADKKRKLGMILSALLTSVGINLGLCLTFFTLYSVLRKQPGNVGVYAPRLVAEGEARRRAHFNFESLLPTAGWVRRAWQPSEDQLLSALGLDAVVFMRIFVFRFGSAPVFSQSSLLAF